MIAWNTNKMKQCWSLFKRRLKKSLATYKMPTDPKSKEPNVYSVAFYFEISFFDWFISWNIKFQDQTTFITQMIMYYTDVNVYI